MTDAPRSPYASALGGWTREDPVREPEFYMDVLHEQLGFSPQRVRMDVYAALLREMEQAQHLHWIARE